MRATRVLLGATAALAVLAPQAPADEPVSTIDRIPVAGKTFKYNAQGVQGLAGNKRVIVAISRGGFYGAGTPAAVGEHHQRRALRQSW